MTARLRNGGGSGADPTAARAARPRDEPPRIPATVDRTRRSTPHDSTADGPHGIGSPATQGSRWPRDLGEGLTRVYEVPGPGMRGGE